MCRFYALCLVLLLTACAGTEEKTLHLWNVAEVMGAPDVKAQVNEKASADVDVVSLRILMHAKQRIELVAGDRQMGLFLADGDEPNGFSFVTHHGPAIAVNTKMLALLGRDEDAMAFLLGHELAHLYLNHGGKRQQRDDDRMEVALVLSFLVGMFGVPLPIEAADAVTTPLENIFSREEELEADRLGVQYMAQANFDLQGAVRLQQKVSALADKGGVLTSHPSSEKRIKNIRSLVASYAHSGVAKSAAKSVKTDSW